jgi:FAD/FMN-containing dehydrogenase
MSDAGDLRSAMRTWRARLGEDAVLDACAAQRCYGSCTIGVDRLIPAALRLRSVEDIVTTVAIAADFGTPLYPISTGNNWGYGSALPPRDGCVIVDLSRLDRIVDFDPAVGLVTVEPGVTQRKLREYLDDRNLPFLVPVTGAGPDCSLVGNALERGYGITPHADHFGAVTALEAVLPDGRLYRSALSELGGETVDRAYKWGIGPYLDGLFAQSGWGIVTRMTIALASRFVHRTLPARSIRTTPIDSISHVARCAALWARRSDNCKSTCMEVRTCGSVCLNSRSSDSSNCPARFGRFTLSRTMCESDFSTSAPSP